jgi:hypothetical protein
MIENQGFGPVSGKPTFRDFVEPAWPRKAYRSAARLGFTGGAGLPNFAASTGTTCCGLAMERNDQGIVPEDVAVHNLHNIRARGRFRQVHFGIECEHIEHVMV